MKKLFSLLFTLFSFFLFLSCSNEDAQIKQTIQEYQTALNNNDPDKLIELCENPDTYTISLASQYIKLFTDKGLKPEYTIDIIELKVKENIAEAKIKTTTNYISDNKEVIEALKYLGTPVTDSIVTLRKTNESWKILTEKVID